MLLVLVIGLRTGLDLDIEDRIVCEQLDGSIPPSEIELCLHHRVSP